MSGKRAFENAIESISEQERRNIIINYIRNNQGCNAEDIVKGVGNHIGRVKVFKVLKVLRKQRMVTIQKLGRDIKHFLNDTNPLVSVPIELEAFEKGLYTLLERAKKITEEKYGPAISEVTLTNKDLTRINSEFASLNLEPLRLMFAMIDAYLLNSTALWPRMIKDKEILKDLYVYVFNKIADIQVHLFQSLSSTRIGNHGKMSDIIIPHIQIRYHMTSSLTRCIKIYGKFNMQKEIEPVIDSLWRVEGGLRKYMYPEPRLYGWDFKYDGTDDWKKLISIQNEHPEQTYNNHVYNTIKNSDYSQLDEVKNSTYMKNETERRKK
jgi:hypothetical protein